MESLLRAKGMELEQLTATCQNLQWLKTELETKSGRWQKEQESALQQLQTSLCNKDKEMEARLRNSRASVRDARLRLRQRSPGLRSQPPKPSIIFCPWASDYLSLNSLYNHNLACHLSFSERPYEN